MRNLVTWLPFLVLCVGGLYAIFAKALRARERTVDEMALLLRHIDLPLLERLLDPEEEALLRSNKSARAFRSIQIGRMAAAREHLGRVSHNAAVLLRWGNGQYAKIDGKNRTQFDSRDLLVIEVVKCAAQVKRHAFYAVAKITTWRLLVIARWWLLPSPSLSDLREVLGIDLLQAYEHLTGAAAQLMMVDGPETYDQVMAAL